MGLGHLEEAATKLPFVRGARQAVDESYTRQKVAKALASAGIPLPQAGNSMELFDGAYQALNKAYDSVGPSVKGTITQKFNNTAAALRAKTLGPKPSQELQAAWGEVESALQNFQAGGQFDRDSFREFSTRLRNIADTFGKAQGDLGKNDAAYAAEQLRKRLFDLLAENNPAAASRLKQVDTGLAKLSRLQEASTYKASRLEGNTVSPETLYDALYKSDTSKGKTDFSRGKVLGQKEVFGDMQVIGGKTPSKDSLGETALAGGAISYGGFLPKTAAILGALGYAPGTKQAIQTAIAGHPEKAAEKLSQIVRGDGKNGLRAAAALGVGPEGLQQLLTQSLREYASKFNKGE